MLSLYMFWPLGIALLILLVKKGAGMKIAATTTFAFGAILWTYIEKETSNDPGYMFPAWHIIYPWFCILFLAGASALVGISNLVIKKESNQNKTEDVTPSS